MQYLARLLGRARALEVMLGGQDYDADLAERYGWINRALPADALGEFRPIVRSPDRQFSGLRPVAVKDRVNAISARAGRGFPSRFRSLRRGRAKP